MSNGLKSSKAQTTAVAIRKKSGKKMDFETIVLIVVMAVMVFLIMYLGTGVVKAGTNALIDNYDESFANERDATYQKYYDKYFSKAEKTYHVANQVSISIKDMKEIASLEVLNISDVEYIIENNNSDGITAWLEVPGKGMYIVDLQTAEFVIDEERAYVLVRVPYPELRNISLDYENIEKLLFKNDIFNESQKVGEELAKKMIDTADLLIKNEFASNQQFYKAAQKAAESTIICMIKQFNPSYPELAVEVEFY